MKRTPWRRLSFDEARFGWRVIHEHNVLPESPPCEGRCREVLVARPEDRRASVLRLEFADGPDRNAGYPQAGVVWFSSGSKLEANLTCPAWRVRRSRWPSGAVGSHGGLTAGRRSTDGCCSKRSCTGTTSSAGDGRRRLGGRAGTDADREGRRGGRGAL